MLESAEGFVDFGYHVVGARTEVGPTDVGGGELQSVEQGAGARQVEIAEDDRSHDLAEGDLDDFRVFENGEIVSGLSGKSGWPVAGEMVIAERLAAHCRRTALGAVGADELTLVERHLFFPCEILATLDPPTTQRKGRGWGTRNFSLRS